MWIDPQTRKESRLFQLFSGTKHHLLLFHGFELQAGNLQDLETIAEEIRQDYLQFIDVHMVIAEDRLPSNWRWDGTVCLDPLLSVHRQYGAQTSCLYLVRPDGYIGYRAQPPSLKKLLMYLAKIFV
jgi:hypothetical protein